MQRRLCNRATTVGTLVWLLLAAGPPPAPVVPLSEVEPGLKGLGWSVFAGHEPEQFEVEVLGVWQKVSPDTSYILSRLSGHGLEETGVIAGMSGSPVYIGDRLLGAVAFGWPFASEAIAGITPIETMRAMANVRAMPVQTAAGDAVAVTDLLRPQASREQLVAGLARLGGAEGATPAGLLWSGVGFGDTSRELLGEAVGTVVAAGRTEDTAVDLQPGDAVAAVLIDGDLRLAATGTVTDRLGDSVLAFGHPFLSLGDVEVPMAAAEIVAVVPSLASSFKIANVGRVLGSFDRDRPAGIRGTLGAEAPMVPLVVEVRGDSTRRFEMRLARISPLAGPLVASAVLGAIDAVSGAGGEQRLDLRAELTLADRSPLVMEQTFDGAAASIGVALHLLNVVGFLANNALSEVEIEAIAIDLEQSRERSSTRIVAAHPSRRIVEPGSTFELMVELDPYRGAPWRHRLSLRLPRDVQAGRYMLLVGDGISIDAARLEIERFEPTRLSQALEFLSGLLSRSQLAVLGVAPARGLAVDGETLPRLPGSIQEIWGAGARSGVTSLRTAIRQELAENLDVPLEGLVRVDLLVRAGESR